MEAFHTASEDRMLTNSSGIIKEKMTKRKATPLMHLIIIVVLYQLHTTEFSYADISCCDNVFISAYMTAYLSNVTTVQILALTLFYTESTENHWLVVSRYTQLTSSCFDHRFVNGECNSKILQE